MPSDVTKRGLVIACEMLDIGVVLSWSEDATGNSPCQNR